MVFWRILSTKFKWDTPAKMVKLAILSILNGFFTFGSLYKRYRQSKLWFSKLCDEYVVIDKAIITKNLNNQIVCNKHKTNILTHLIAGQKIPSLNSSIRNEIQRPLWLHITLCLLEWKPAKSISHFYESDTHTKKNDFCVGPSIFQILSNIISERLVVV